MARAVDDARKGLSRRLSGRVRLGAPGLLDRNGQIFSGAGREPGVVYDVDPAEFPRSKIETPTSHPVRPKPGGVFP